MKPTINALVSVYKDISRCNYCGTLKSLKEIVEIAIIQKKILENLCGQKYCGSMEH